MVNISMQTRFNSSGRPTMCQRVNARRFDETINYQLSVKSYSQFLSLLAVAKTTKCARGKLDIWKNISLDRIVERNRGAEFGWGKSRHTQRAVKRSKNTDRIPGGGAAEFSPGGARTFRTFPTSNPLEPARPISASNTLIIRRREPRQAMKRIPSWIPRARSRAVLRAI